MNLLFEVISLLICIGIPVLGGIYFAVKGKGYFLTFLTEAMEAKLTAELIREPGGGKGEIIPKLRFTLEMKKVEKFMQKE